MTTTTPDRRAGSTACGVPTGTRPDGASPRPDGYRRSSAARLPAPMRLSIDVTWIMVATWWMYATNMATLASSSATPAVVETAGTNESSVVLRTVRRTSTAYTNVATNTPSATWVSRSRRNVRSTRGEYWLLVNWSTTMVIEKTRPVNVIIEVEMAERTSRAPSGPAPNVQSPPKPCWRRRSTATSTLASPTARTTQSAGTAQKPDRTESRRARSRFTASPPAPPPVPFPSGPRAAAAAPGGRGR